ncbi:MAG: DUF4280 domain-containing protein [Acidimicrobiales bacterium]|nr:DUF4280 domain-containing protein [Acidimicrobiales bacterium]
MGMLITHGAVMTCSFGAAPATYVALPTHKLLGDNKPAANIMDNVPMLNIPSFGMCSSLANPTVAAATAAALGALTPMPCMPVTAAPWAPGSPKVLIANMPALTDSSKCICNWGGTIAFSVPSQFKVQVA